VRCLLTDSPTVSQIGLLPSRRDEAQAGVREVEPEDVVSEASVVFRIDEDLRGRLRRDDDVERFSETGWVGVWHDLKWEVKGKGGVSSREGEGGRAAWLMKRRKARGEGRHRG